MRCIDPSAAITFEQIAGAWFIHDQQIWPVASAPASMFRAAVLAQAPQWKDIPVYSEVLASATLDTVTRWWLLCGLADAGQAMMLYASREEAERALDQPTIAL